MESRKEEHDGSAGKNKEEVEEKAEMVGKGKHKEEVDGTDAGGMDGSGHGAGEDKGGKVKYMRKRMELPDQKDISRVNLSLFSTEKELKYKAYWLEKRRKKDQRRKESGLPRKKRRKDTILDRDPAGATIVLDYQYQGELTTKELRSLASQSSFVYAHHRRALKPVHLHLVGVNGLLQEALDVFQANKWRNIHQHEGQLLDVFKDRTDDIVYLSPDATEDLLEVDSTKIYVIGGIVDRDRLRNYSKNFSEKQNLRCVRLPLARTVKEHALDIRVNPKLSLSVNGVYEMLQRVVDGVSWADAIMERYPQRKRFRQNGQSGVAGKQEDPESAVDGADVKLEKAKEEESEGKDVRPLE
eukprot:CAMPEP_0119135564 /NCGR_PEP_ID=MMETSP1310-20130426/19528_1 /TAXON_ID=464262 /ORGANISM="Genus nov. species nov., Strain RCC2339" /LENGTH=354 /DNA_ID=CAMNT_0007126459 /DNA_START=139 /DNA_END=1200 /DNA_ORIENTATION=+